MEGLFVLVVALGSATAFGLWRRRTDGRMTVVAPAAAGSGTSVDPTGGAGDPAGALGDGAADDSEPLLVDGRAVQAVDHGSEPAADHLTAADVGGPLGERATLVQFSSAFCQPCRATRLVLGEVAGVVPGVAHAEIDAESNLDLVRRLDVTRTPTVLLLDASGRIRTRATGAPRKADVLAALADIV